VLLLLAGGTPAGAHGGATGGSYYATVTGLSEPVAGVVVSGDGSTLTVTSTAPDDLVVLGYAGEEFLRLSADGAWLAPDSPTTRTVAGDSLVRRTTSGGWAQVAARGRYSWVDERVGQEPDATPPGVLQRPREHQVVGAWHVPVRYGDRALSIDGRTWWEPTQYSAGLTLAVVLGVLGLGLLGAVALVVPRRRTGDAPQGDAAGPTVDQGR
jgi:hypothetical protein